MIVPRRRALEHELADHNERLRFSIVLLGGREHAEQDTWHHLGDPGEPTFENGWENADPDERIDTAPRFLENPTLAGFVQSSHDWVHLKGAIAQPAGWTDFQVMFTLPIGYRPPTEFSRELHIAIMYVIDSTGALKMGGAMLGIGSNGAVWGEGADAVVVNCQRVTWLALDGISYRIV